MAEHIVGQMEGADIHNRDEFLAERTRLLEAFPDLSIVADDMVSEGQKVQPPHGCDLEPRADVMNVLPATYFTAVYPDVAVAPACTACHNGHKDSPRTDFSLGDVMGGVVVRIPVG